jgi:hypothetical protein
VSDETAERRTHDDELGELADLHGAMVDECARIALLVLGDRAAATDAAVDAFVLAHRRWYVDEDRVRLLHRSLARALARADKVPRERPDEPLLAAFASLGFDQRLATAFSCVAGLRAEDLGAALGTDAGEAEARFAAGAAGVTASLSPGADLVARCTALPGVVDADESLLAVLRGVTHQVHVRQQPRWVYVAMALGALLIAAAIILSIDWGGGDDDVRITGIDDEPLVATTVPAEG